MVPNQSSKFWYQIKIRNFGTKSKFEILVPNQSSKFWYKMFADCFGQEPPFWKLFFYLDSKTDLMSSNNLKLQIFYVEFQPGFQLAYLMDFLMKSKMFDENDFRAVTELEEYRTQNSKYITHNIISLKFYFKNYRLN